MGLTLGNMLRLSGRAIVVAFLVANCVQEPTSVFSTGDFDTAIALSNAEVAPDDSLMVTVSVTNRSSATQKLVFGCGFTIGIVLVNSEDEWVAGDQVCPTVMVDLILEPEESAIRKTRFAMIHYSDGRQLAPGQYTARGGLWGLSGTHPWAEAEFSIKTP